MGDFVFIKKLTGAERASLLNGSVKVDGKQVDFNADNFLDMQIRMVQLAVCDEAGVRIFDDSSEDFDLVNSLDGDMLDLLFQEIGGFNGIGATEEKAALKN
jgi:hypothetical protein